MEKVNLSNRHILIVEGNPDDAYLIQRAMQKVPFCTSFLCRTLSEAKAYLARTGVFQDEKNYPRPEAVITELRFDLESGADLFTWMRETKAVPPIPIYVLSDAISPNDRKTLVALGATRVIDKPTETAELKVLLEQIAQEICDPKKLAAGLPGMMVDDHSAARPSGIS